MQRFKDGPLFFIGGGGGGLPFLGLANNFFLNSNALQTIFFTTFCNENNFFTTIFKKCYRLFFKSYLKKHFLCMHTHEKSHMNETISP